jgi:hypothetical protein
MEKLHIHLRLIYPGYSCYGVGGTRGAAQRLARDSFPPCI